MSFPHSDLMYLGDGRDEAVFIYFYIVLTFP
jgi:hypothetical protein